MAAYIAAWTGGRAMTEMRSALVGCLRRMQGSVAALGSITKDCAHESGVFPPRIDTSGFGVCSFSELALPGRPHIIATL